MCVVIILQLWQPVTTMPLEKSVISFEWLSKAYRCFPLHSLCSPPEPCRPGSLQHVTWGFRGQCQWCPRLLGCRGQGPRCEARRSPQVGPEQSCAGLPEPSRSGRRLVLQPGRWEWTRRMNNNHTHCCNKGAHSWVYIRRGTSKGKCSAWYGHLMIVV